MMLASRVSLPNLAFGGRWLVRLQRRLLANDVDSTLEQAGYCNFTKYTDEIYWRDILTRYTDEQHKQVHVRIAMVKGQDDRLILTFAPRMTVTFRREPKMSSVTGAIVNNWSSFCSWRPGISQAIAEIGAFLYTSSRIYLPTVGCGKSSWYQHQEKRI